MNSVSQYYKHSSVMKMSVCIQNTNTLSWNQIRCILTCAYNKYKQIISNVPRILLRKRIIIWETIPLLVKAARKRILRSRASNQQEEDSKCVSGGEKNWWKDELWGVCVCLGVFTITEQKSVTVAKILTKAQAGNDGKKNWVRPQAHSPLWCLRSQQNLTWRKLQRAEK